MKSGAAASSGDLRIIRIGQVVDPADGATSDPLRVIDDAFIEISAGRITAVGSMADLPPGDAPCLDAGGRVVLPGLIDSHTHAVFGTTREHEFERRLAGATYQQIAAEGGGIAYSVGDLRRRDEDELVELSRPRLERFLRFGVTTVEVKSGYGLATDHELKMLRVIDRLSGDSRLPHLVPTFLGAHAIPQEYADDRASYVREVVDEMLPAVVDAGLARFCDVFCEEGAFTLAESEAILSRAAELGMDLKIHADEFTPSGGAQLAVRLGAVSADHLVAIDEDGIAALAGSETVATLLPGTSFFLRLGRHAPGRALADAGARLALATDFNPGSSMTQNLLLMIAFSCCNQGLTIDEAIRAVTAGGARAVREPDRGTLAVGAIGDVAVFDVEDYRHLAYHYGVDHCVATVREGRVVWRCDSRNPTLTF